MDDASALEVGLDGRGGIAGLGEELRVALENPESVKENTLLILVRGLWRDLGGCTDPLPKKF